MKNLCIAIAVLSLVAGCAGPGMVTPPQPAVPFTPTPVPAQTIVSPSQLYWPTQGWRTSTPEQQGMDSAQLVQMLDAVNASKLSIHSILIIRHGYLVAEVYYGSNSPTLKHELYSVTKSFTSALVGMAIQKGGLDQSMTGYAKDRVFMLPWATGHAQT